MLQIKPFRQKTGFCGPACLKMVLSYYGIEKTEKELAVIANTTKKDGTPESGMIDAAKNLGLNVELKNDCTMKDLEIYVKEKKIPVIVAWFSEYVGHYSVVVDIDQENIYLMDPELGHMKAMTRARFKTLWFSFPDTFIKKKEDLILRLAIIIWK